MKKKSTTTNEAPGVFIPAFKKNLPPTDRAVLNKKQINHGTEVPQISISMWKSANWKGFAQAFPFSVGGFCLFVGIVGANDPNEAELARAMLFIGVACLFLFIPFRFWGRTIYRLGFDWNTNTCWIERKGKGIIAVEPDATTMTGFEYSDFHSYRMNPTWHLNRAHPPYWTKHSIFIAVKRTRSEFAFPIDGVVFASKKEALELIRLANELLQKESAAG